MKRPQAELLSPAGSLDILKAVAFAGADAVYAAGTRFGARAYAGNLTEDELLYAIDYLHLHGKRLYLTVNTLLKEDELNRELFDYINPLYRQGLDGVIVQDPGVLRFLREHFPGMKLHASTQTTLTGIYGARLMKELGCSRIVPARELSLEEIRQIHDTVDIEIESFIHGALCYCYSGQCLFSSMLGGRSGNRGRCAQPCRLPYRTKKSKDNYLLSPKDLCTIELLPEILKSGVCSLKIEGRMKQAEYAAGVTGIYREYLDRYLAHPEEEYKVSPRDLKRLEDLGSRSGFTKGYYIQKNGSEMMAMKKPAHTKSDDELQEEMRNRFLNREIQEKMKGILKLSKETCAELVLQCKGVEIAVQGDVVQKAKSRPMDKAAVEEKLRKTGGSGFEFEELTIFMDDDIFIPVGALNQLRRNGIEALRERLLAEFKRFEPHYHKSPEIKTFWEQKEPYLAVSVSTKEQCMQLLEKSYIDRIYIDSSMFDRETEAKQLAAIAETVHKSGKKLYYIMPHIMRAETTGWYEKNIHELLCAKTDGFVAGSYEALEFLREARTFLPEENKIKILTDSGLYAWSGQAAEALKEAGADELTLPAEANEHELRNRKYSGGELLIYGYQPLMYSAQCLVKNTEGCHKKAGFTSLTDRYGKVFTVKNQCKDCYNILYNTSPLSLLHQQEAVGKLKAEGYRISFTRENEKQIEEVMSYFEQGYIRKEKTNKLAYLNDFTNGHFKRGVE